MESASQPSPTAGNNIAPSVFAHEIEAFTGEMSLSRRETDIVVTMIRNITSSDDIAKSLRISTHTVNNHLKSIFEKSGASSKTELLASFLRFAAGRLQKRPCLARRAKAMIVGDDPMLCSFISNGLRDRGIRTTVLTSPAETVRTLTRLQVDLVICDLNMPHTNSLDLVREIRRTLPAWPPIVLLGTRDSYSLPECLNLGVAACMDKPLDLDALVQLMVGQLYEPGRERSQALGIDGKTPHLWPNVVELGLGDLGSGGAFLPVSAASQRRNQANVGSLMTVTLAPIAARSTITVTGIVAWKRTQEDDQLRAGIGLRFLELTDPDQIVLDEILRSHDTTSFIPLGGTEARLHSEKAAQVHA